jgi:hypothetical protein
MIAAPVVELCPRCASRPIDESNTETGWCAQCSDAVVVENYIAREDAAIAERRRKWKKRSASDASEALKWRQRKHRLIAAVQPNEPPPPNCDPYELAYRALQSLKRLEPTAAKSPPGHEHLELIRETVKQLAVGPGD